MAVTKDEVLRKLAEVKAPNGAPLTAAKVLSEIVASDGKVFFSITVDASQVPAWEGVRKQAESAVRSIPGVVSAMVALTAERAGAGAGGAPRAAPGTRATPPGARAAPPGGAGPGAQAPRHGAAQSIAPAGVKSIIAVASGKGGVGKSTVAINLAIALLSLGLKVGVLDADIYGPSVPKLLGITGRPEMIGEGNRLAPMSGYGLKVMSIGFLVEEETPMIWRGPMVMSALTQMLRDVEWGELDLMVVDMPPGTGDAQLTMAQQVPLKGAVIVSTPQDLALIDARRGIGMFRRVNVPVLGIIENMSYFLCPSCGTRSEVFGHGGARHEAERLGVPFLGEVPLDIEIRQTSDAGRPVAAQSPQDPRTAIFRAIAGQVWSELGGAPSRPPPRIVIEA
jgi:ATP-binding protein involved in chromosome partitioning